MRYLANTTQAARGALRESAEQSCSASSQSSILTRRDRRKNPTEHVVDVYRWTSTQNAKVTRNRSLVLSYLR